MRFNETIFLVFSVLILKSRGDRPSTDENGTISRTICDGQLAELSCPTGRVVSIVIGNYGRFSNQVCNDDADNFVPSNNNCQNHKTKSILERKCNGKPTCDFEVSKKTFLDDPCPQTSKYLEVKYQCLDRATTSTTTTTTTTEATVTEEKGRAVSVQIDTDDDDIRPEIDADKLAVKPTLTKKQQCEETIQRGVVWPTTETGKTAKVACPEGTTGRQFWDCSEGTWSNEGANTTGCESEWAVTRSAALSEVVSNEDASGLPEVLRKLTADTRRPMVAGDVPKVILLLERITDLLVEEPWTRNIQVLANKGLVEVINNVIRHENEWKSWQLTRRREMATRILMLLEKAMLSSSQHMLSSVESNTIVQPSIIAEVSHRLRVSTQPSDYIVFPSAAIWSDQLMDKVDVPREALMGAAVGDEAQVYFSSLANIGDQMVPRDLIVPPSNPNEVAVLRKRRIISRVVGATLVHKGKVQRVEKLKQPIRITFYHHSFAVEKMSSPTCAWWNPHQLDWSPVGCKISYHNKTVSVCDCDHLTHFAILMDVNGYKFDDTNNTILTMATYFGCSISVICLLLTFLCYVIFSRGGGDRVFIHENLCLSLAAAELVFLLGIRKTDDLLQCSVVAILLLYLFLAALHWMLLEAYHIYRMLVEVFPGSSRRIIYTLIGYGSPAVITTIAYFYNPNGFGTKEHCWLRSDDKFIMFFVGPASAILFINSIVLVKTLCIVYQHSTGGYLPCRHENESGRSIRSWVKGAMALACLLGVTWTIGLLWLDDPNEPSAYSVIQAYAFTICNSLQGLFIFLFHVVFADKMRKDITHWLSRRGCGSSSESSPKRNVMPRDVLAPTMGSSGSEFLYPSCDKYQRSLDTTSQSVYSHDAVSAHHQRFYQQHLPGMPPHLQHHVVYEPQQGGTYDYATIAYGDMVPGGVVGHQLPPPAYHRLPCAPHQMNNYQSDMMRYASHSSQQQLLYSPGRAQSHIHDPAQGGPGWHHRPPPEFSPPTPPSASSTASTSGVMTSTLIGRRPPSSKMSDDSAYSDGGSSSMLTTEVTPQGHTVLRIDLGKNSQPNMYCQEL